jgi:hypothetical protein
LFKIKKYLSKIIQPGRTLALVVLMLFAISFSYRVNISRATNELGNIMFNGKVNTGSIVNTGVTISIPNTSNALEAHDKLILRIPDKFRVNFTATTFLADITASSDGNLASTILAYSNDERRELTITLGSGDRIDPGESVTINFHDDFLETPEEQGLYGFSLRTEDSSGKVVLTGIALLQVRQSGVVARVRVTPPRSVTAECAIPGSPQSGTRLNWDSSLSTISGGVKGYNVYYKASEAENYQLFQRIILPFSPLEILVSDANHEGPWDFMVRAFDHLEYESKLDCESCKAENVLIDCSSSGGNNEPPNNGGGSNLPPDPECSQDSDCAEDEICDNGSCNLQPPECQTNSDCEAGEVCLENSCSPADQPKCNQDSDCPTGQYCAMGNCSEVPPECESDSDCNFEQICQNEICVDPKSECNSDQDCPEDKICANEVCVDDFCKVDSDCAELEICESGDCLEVDCKTDEHCLAGETCIDYQCEEEQLIKIIAWPQKRIPKTGNWDTHNTLEVRYPGETESLYTTKFDTDEQGVYFGVDLLSNVGEGVYDVTIKGYSHLRFKKYNVQVDADLEEIDFTAGGTDFLLAGDTDGTDGDNFVNALDISKIVDQMYTDDERCDLNQEFIVNALDIAITIDNMYVWGDE